MKWTNIFNWNQDPLINFEINKSKPNQQSKRNTNKGEALKFVDAIEKQIRKEKQLCFYWDGAVEKIYRIDILKGSKKLKSGKKEPKLINPLHNPIKKAHYPTIIKNKTIYVYGFESLKKNLGPSLIN